VVCYRQLCSGQARLGVPITQYLNRREPAEGRIRAYSAASFI